MHYRLLVLLVVSTMQFPSAVYALPAVEVKNGIMSAINSVAEEVTFFKDTLIATASVPGNDFFRTTSAGVVSNPVSHTPSDDAGSTGTITYTFNADSLFLEGSTLVFSYSSTSGSLDAPFTCEYTVGVTASVDVTAAQLDPDGSTTANLFSLSEYPLLQGCIPPP